MMHTMRMSLFDALVANDKATYLYIGPLNSRLEFEDGTSSSGPSLRDGQLPFADIVLFI